MLIIITYSSCSSIPLSSTLLLTFCVVDLFVPSSGENVNSRSACSGSGVGVSNTNVSTIDPFEEPKDTLTNKKTKQF